MSKHPLQVIKSSYSDIGPHNAYFFDLLTDTFFSFSDDGGWFGDKKRHILSLDKFIDASIMIFLSRENNELSLYGHLKFSDGEVIYKCLGSKITELFLRRIINTEHISKVFSILYFPGQLSHGNSESITKMMFSDNSVEFLFNYVLSNEVKNCLISNKTFPVCINTVSNRTHIKLLGSEDVADFPISKTIVKASESMIFFNNQISLSGLTLNGLKLEIPSQELAELIIKQLKFPNSESNKLSHPNGYNSVVLEENRGSGLMSKVKVEGYINGRKLEMCECDAELLLHALILHLPNEEKKSQNHIEIFFEDVSVAIDVTLNYFLISNSANSMVKITGSSENFHRSLMINRLVMSAAYRSANCGPFIAVTDSGEILRIEIEQDSVLLIQAGKSYTIDHSGIDSTKLIFDKDHHRLCFNSMQLSAELPMLEGIAAGLGAMRTIRVVEGNFKNSVAALLGLEGEYFTYTVFGHFADTQISLAKGLNRSPFDNISSIQSDYEKKLFLACMISSAGSLARELETTIHHLPYFSMARDEELINLTKSQGSLNKKNIENAYQSALSSVSSLLGHLYKIESATFRLSALRNAIARSSGVNKFTSIGIGVAAGFINPYLWLGAAKEGISMFTSQESQETLRDEIENDVFTICAHEWDYIIHTLMPALAYRLAANIYPIRLTSTKIFIQSFENSTNEREITQAAANRFGRLQTFKEFPVASGDDSRRSESIKFLFQIQKNVETTQFRYF